MNRSLCLSAALSCAFLVSPATASFVYEGHARAIAGQSYNLGTETNFGDDTAGALEGADLVEGSTDPNTPLRMLESLTYGPDIFGRQNFGSLAGFSDANANAQGQTVSFVLRPHAFGDAAPQATMDGSSTTFFSVTEDTKASVYAGFSGSIPGTQDQVVASLIEYDPITGNMTSQEFNLAREFAGTPLHSGDTGAFDVDLRAGFDYELFVSAAARATAPNDVADNQYHSAVTVSVSVAQGALDTSESDPLKPNTSYVSGIDSLAATHVFALDAASATQAETVWLDPEIATGFAYDIFGGVVTQITLPSLTAVNDLDGYEIWADGSLLAAVAASDVLDVDDLTSFEVRGINPALALDPGAVGQFVLGLSFAGATGDTITVTQTALTTEVSAAGAVPLPAAAWLLLAGLAGLAATRRRLC